MIQAGMIEEMKSTVWFASLRARSPNESTEAKVARLFEAAGFASCIQARDRTANKLHCGEQGNHSYISPDYVRLVGEKVKAAGPLPLLPSPPPAARRPG